MNYDTKDCRWVQWGPRNKVRDDATTDKVNQNNILVMADKSMENHVVDKGTQKSINALANQQDRSCRHGEGDSSKDEEANHRKNGKEIDIMEPSKMVSKHGDNGMDNKIKNKGRRNKNKGKEILVLVETPNNKKAELWPKDGDDQNNINNALTLWEQPQKDSHTTGISNRFDATT